MSDPNPKPSTPPTSTDVARLANVSRATVSYVLNDVPEARVSEETRKRVLEAAASLGYVPHEIASSLRSGRSELVLLPFFDWPYNQSSIAYLQEIAQHLDQLGYTVMLRFFGRRDQKWLARKIASFHPVGVIVGSGEFSEADVEILHRNGVKAILAYEAQEEGPIPSIGADFTSVGECAGRYLLHKGYSSLAALVPVDKRIIHLGLQRLEGLARACQEADLPVERVNLDYDTRMAAQLAARWATGPRPRAVFTYNDEYGMLLMSALQDAGIAIPQEIALVGCDNLALGEMLRPRLTTIDIAQGVPGKKVAGYLDDLIQGREPQMPPRMPVACHLVERDSS